MGNPIVKIENKNAQHLPFPLHDVDPHLIHHASADSIKLRLRRFTHFRTVTPQTPHWLQWGAPHSLAKLSRLVYRSLNLTTCLIPGPIRPTIPNRIHIWSDQPFCHNALDRQTSRWLEGMFNNYRPLSLYRERQRGLVIIRVLINTPKVLHMLRCSPLANNPALQLFDGHLRSSQYQVCNHQQPRRFDWHKWL